MNTDDTRGPFLPRAEAARGRKLVPYVRSAKGVRVRDLRTRRLARRILTAWPWLTDADKDLVRAFAQIQILADEAFAKIRAEGIVRPTTGQPHPLLSEFRALIRTEADLAGRLGLSPRDRAAMQASSTGAALERIDLKRVDRILRARRSGTPVNGDGGDAPIIEANGEVDADDPGSDRERTD
jgi:hypothetical protein